MNRGGNVTQPCTAWSESSNVRGGAPRHTAAKPQRHQLSTKHLFWVLFKLFQSHNLLEVCLWTSGMDGVGRILAGKRNAGRYKSVYLSITINTVLHSAPCYKKTLFSPQYGRCCLVIKQVLKFSIRAQRTSCSHERRRDAFFVGASFSSLDVNLSCVADRYHAQTYLNPTETGGWGSC